MDYPTQNPITLAWQENPEWRHDFFMRIAQVDKFNYELFMQKLINERIETTKKAGFK